MDLIRGHAVSGENVKGRGISAFTLVELLTVTAIVGILAALLLTAISQSKARASRIQCVNNLRQLGVGLQTILADNHGYPVFRISTNKSVPVGDRFWMGQLEREGLGILHPATNFYEAGVWICPSTQWSDSMQRGIITSKEGAVYYGYNDDKYGPAGRLIDPDNQFGLQGHYDPVTKTYRAISESEVAVPSDMMAMGDNFEANAIFQRRVLEILEGFGNTLTRHQGKANVVFCDGHVESPTLNSLFVDISNAALVRWHRDHQPHPENL
jgi:prepilin-type processing-associated H-X9-DG protein/prepilin-type N-terminal cleavage/methylation domain-containing protein